MQTSAVRVGFEEIENEIRSNTVGLGDERGVPRFSEGSLIDLIVSC